MNVLYNSFSQTGYECFIQIGYECFIQFTFTNWLWIFYTNWLWIFYTIYFHNWLWIIVRNLFLNFIYVFLYTFKYTQKKPQKIFRPKKKLNLIFIILYIFFMNFSFLLFFYLFLFYDWKTFFYHLLSFITHFSNKRWLYKFSQDVAPFDWFRKHFYIIYQSGYVYFSQNDYALLFLILLTFYLWLTNCYLLLLISLIKFHDNISIGFT